MKYILIVYIALGFVLSMIFGLEYKAAGVEEMPVFFASPFIFKQKSLGSTMTYFYSISGIVFNVAVWGLLLFLIDKAVAKFKRKHRFRPVYFAIVGVLVIFSSFNLAQSIITEGRGFSDGSNYWYFDLAAIEMTWDVNYNATVALLNL